VWERRTRDYLRLMAHHFATVALVLGSLAYGLLPIGVVVMWVHDATDVVTYPRRPASG
jgi:ceramide synthetase